MSKFALLLDGKVQNFVVADSEDTIGEAATVFDVVDVTYLNPQPSVGWTLEGETWFPPKITAAVKDLWNGAGFNETIEVQEVKKEAKAIEAEATPAPTKSTKKGA